MGNDLQGPYSGVLQNMSMVKSIISKNLQIIGAMIVCHVTLKGVSIVVVVTQLVYHPVAQAEQPIRHQEQTSRKVKIWVTIRIFHSNV